MCARPGDARRGRASETRAFPGRSLGTRGAAKGALLAGLALLMCVVAGTAAGFAAGQVPEAVRAQFSLAPFYQKHIDVGGLPVVGSAKVSDAALAECAWIVRQMLGKRPDILAAMGKAGVRFAVMAHDEYTTDIPEHSQLKPRVFWDRRARGLGATPDASAVSAAEENLLAYPGDPYPREIIAIHEFAHAIHEMGMKTVDPTFDDRLKAAYESAIAAGLWKGMYAAVNRQEYWAEVVQAWFDNNATNDALHNDIGTREKLKTYDPDVAALCFEVFGDGPWRYQKPAARAPEDRAHLGDFDPAKARRFQWRSEPVPDHPRITLQCAAGEVQFEIDGPGERIEQLLAQIQEGYFSSGRAKFSKDGLDLSAAAKTPDGASVPKGEGGWRVFLGDPPPDSISAKVIKGGVLIPQLIRESGAEGVRVQRIVRLN